MKAVPKKKLIEENRVIIRFWTSGLNKKVPGEGVGHVSIEIPKLGQYMSLWPEGLPNENIIRASLEKRKTHYQATYEDDLDTEGREPEKVYCLYSLNTDDMVTKFTALLKTNEHWTLLGNTLLLPRGNSHSCATLAYELLKEGGIFNIISSAYSSNFSSVVAPDTLLPAINAAKKAETQNYKETIGYDENFITNTHEEVTQNANNIGFCNIT